MSRTKGSLGKKTLAKMAGQGLLPDDIQTKIDNGNSEQSPIVSGELKKRGRPKGSGKKKLFAAPVIYAEKEEKREQSLQQEYDAKIPRVASTAKLSGNIAHFVGEKGYASALDQAYQWAQRNGIELNNFYQQEFGHKCILVGYTRH